MDDFELSSGTSLASRIDGLTENDDYRYKLKRSCGGGSISLEMSWRSTRGLLLTNCEGVKDDHKHR